MKVLLHQILPFVDTRCSNRARCSASLSVFWLTQCSELITLSSIFSGLPYRLPDTVCPAAMLQYVLRPPQQHRETNSTVYRPLAPPSATSTHPLPHLWRPCIPQNADCFWQKLKISSTRCRVGLRWVYWEFTLLLWWFTTLSFPCTH